MSGALSLPNHTAQGHEPTLLDRARMWRMILSICIEERLVYRGDFVLGTVMRFLPLITQIYLWSAIFAARGSIELSNYSQDDMIAYLLLTMMGRAFSSMPGLASTIALQIRNGEIKKYLIQPIDMITFLLLSRIAHKLVYYFVAAAPFALIFYVCRGYFPGWPDPLTFCAFVASLILSFLLGFYLEVTLGMIGFWFLEVTSLLFVYMLISYFLSGQMFPIIMVPEPWLTILQLTPLPYLAYFPAAVFLQKVQGPDLIFGLIVETSWVIGLILTSRLAFKLGVRRYSGYGG